MIAELARELARLKMPGGGSLTADEITDILWLAPAYIASDDRTDSAGSLTPPAPPDPTGPPGSRPPATPERNAPGLSAADTSYVPLYLPTRSHRARNEPDTAIPASPVAFRAPPALPRALELTRSLRRFKRVTRPGRPQVDIQASVQATAHAERLMVVMTRPPVRALDLALVVDAGSSMRVWDRTLDELQQILAQVGAFRTVSRWSLHLRKDEERGYHIRLADAGGHEHPVRRLIDPSGSRLILLATDAVADGWYSQSVWKEIESLVTAMPAAVLQMLPRRYWPETALGQPYVKAHAPYPGAPNSAYLMRTAVWMPQARGVAVPVVELTPSALGGWALAAVAGTEWIEGVTTDPALPEDEETPTRANSGLTKAELVRTFIDRASPGAVRLAQLLSSAPLLTSAVVDLLQGRMLPETGISERAEIFVSGLLEEVSGGFRFEAEAAKALQAGATSFERWDIFDVVTDYLRRRPGIGGDLRVLVPDRDGGQRLNTRDEPFAAWARDLAEGLGVRDEQFGPVTPGGTRSTARPVSSSPALTGVRVLDRTATDVFAQAIASLNGVPLNVVDVGERGIMTFDVQRDETGTPRSAPYQPTPWAELGGTVLSEALVTRAARLRHEVENLLVCTHPDDGPALQAMEILRTARPESPAMIVPDAEVNDLIHTAIDETPLYRPYELVVLRRTTENRVELATMPMFEVGARRGAVAEMTVNCEAVNGRSTVLAVVARDSRRQPRLVTKLSAVLPRGRQSLTAVLAGPGAITFRDLETAPAEEPWSDLVAQASHNPYRSVDRIHLVCAIDVGGPAERFLERLGRIRQIITTLGRNVPAHLLWVSLIQYGEHSFAYQRLRDPTPETLWTASADRILQELAWLERRGPRPTRYPRAAMVEDMLAMVAGFVPATGTGADRTALVIVGDRPPHPPRQDLSYVLPCPLHFDWKKSVDRLRLRPGMTIGAICDQPPDRLHRSWYEICDVPPTQLETVDVRVLIDDLRLGGPAPVHVVFPLVESS